jgi:hypothetical protein
MTLMRAAVVSIALTLCSCSAAAPVTMPSASPGAACQTAGLKEAQLFDGNARLAAAFVSNVADVASWESHGYSTGWIRIETSPSSDPGAPLDRVDVCYYGGAFSIGGHPLVPAGGTFFPPYELLLVTVNADGVAKIATAGHRDTMPLASPAHGP